MFQINPLELLVHRVNKSSILKGMGLATAVTFFVLCLIILALSLVFIYYYNQAYLAETNPNYWCYDDWVCPGSTGSTGLASSIYGPNAPVNQNCNGCDGAPGSTGCEGCTCAFDSTSLNVICTAVFQPGNYTAGSQS